ncbi:MAG: hypothetical protein JJE04_24360 [Acidobacteriia bacterium]|nr:hypothetical protein [Terriglobia bacterium]
MLNAQKVLFLPFRKGLGDELIAVFLSISGQAEAQNPFKGELSQGLSLMLFTKELKLAAVRRLEQAGPGDAFLNGKQRRPKVVLPGRRSSA